MRDPPELEVVIEFFDDGWEVCVTLLLEEEGVIQLKELDDKLDFDLDPELELVEFEAAESRAATNAAAFDAACPVFVEDEELLLPDVELELGLDEFPDENPVICPLFEIVKVLPLL